PTTSYFEHNKLVRGPQLIRQLQEGRRIALVTDAGTPGISDPGFMLVRDARAAGIGVVPVPGPAAVVTALSAAGLPADRFGIAGGRVLSTRGPPRGPPAGAPGRRLRLRRLRRLSTEPRRRSQHRSARHAHASARRGPEELRPGGVRAPIVGAGAPVARPRAGGARALRRGGRGLCPSRRARAVGGTPLARG